MLPWILCRGDGAVNNVSLFCFKPAITSLPEEHAWNTSNAGWTLLSSSPLSHFSANSGQKKELCVYQTTLVPVANRNVPIQGYQPQEHRKKGNISRGVA